MNTVIVWVLMTVSGNGVVTYSPPFLDKQECERVKSAIPLIIQNRMTTSSDTCVNMTVVK